MFTGIVETTAPVRSLTLGETTGHLILEEVPFAQALELGESVAVNGVCLTVVKFGGGQVAFDLLAETLRITNLGSLKSGSLVNLERAMRADTRFSGHFVQGHVDGTANILGYEAAGNDHRLQITIPPPLRRYLISKGSITISGMSLTIAELAAQTLTIWITPHTHAVTTLRAARAGDVVNLEVDMMAKYVDQLLEKRLAQPQVG